MQASVDGRRTIGSATDRFRQEPKGRHAIAPIDLDSWSERRSIDAPPGRRRECPTGYDSNVWLHVRRAALGLWRQSRNGGLNQSQESGVAGPPPATIDSCETPILGTDVPFCR